MKIIEVVWLDAQSSLQHLSVKEAKEKIKPKITKSIGYLVFENKEYMLLAFMKFGNDSFKHWQLIPKGMIKIEHIIKKNDEK